MCDLTINKLENNKPSLVVIVDFLENIGILPILSNKINKTFTLTFAIEKFSIDTLSLNSVHFYRQIVLFYLFFFLNEEWY